MVLIPLPFNLFYRTLMILINLFLILILLIKGNILKLQVKEKVLNKILWIFFFFFIVNTFANLFAKTTSEKLFSVLTIILAILIWNVINRKEKTKSNQ